MEYPDCLKLAKRDKQKLDKLKEWLEAEARQRGKDFAKCLHRHWEKFYRLPLYQERGLHMNYALLSQAAVSFWEDLLRIKAYHDIEYSDRHKLAAHLFKWLSRMRPIKPGNDHSGASKLELEVLQANALFALACTQSFLECSEFSDSERQYIIYASTNRDIHAREWSMIFYLLEKIHPVGP